MSDGVYSPSKAAAFPERIAAIARGEQINPVHLHLILSDLCSLACPGCFPPGTLVLAEDGYEPIERIEEGMRVWSHDGKLHTVTKTMPHQYDGELIKIRPYKLGSAIRATPEHPFLVVREDGSKVWLKAGDLRVGDKVAIRVPEVPIVPEIRLSKLLDDLSPAENGHVRAYKGKTTSPDRIPLNAVFGEFLGLYLGDGQVGKLYNRPGSYSVSISFGLHEREIADRCVSHVKELFAVDAALRTHDNLIELEIGSAIVGRLVLKLCRIGSHDKQFHPALLGGSVEFLEGLVRGYAWADGCIDDKSFSTVSRPLALMVYKLALQLGLSPSLFEQPGRPSMIKGRVIHSLGSYYTTRLRGEDISIYSKIVGVEPEPSLKETPSGLPCRTCFSKDTRQVPDPRYKLGFQLVCRACSRANQLKVRRERGQGTSWNKTERDESGLVLLPISSLERQKYSGPVYNFEVEDSNSYIADGLAVHNCSYRLPGYSSNQRFGIVDLNGIMNNNPNRMLQTPLVEQTLREFREMGGLACEFTGGGEPTLHPKCDWLIQYAQRIGLDTALITHGLHLVDKILPTTVERLAWLRISIDAATSDTYGKVRPSLGKPNGLNLFKALAALSWARHAIDLAGSKCVLGAGFVVQHENWHELYDAVKLYREAGAMNVRISGLFTPQMDHYFEGWRERAVELERRAIADFDRLGFRVHGRLSEKLSDLAGPPDYPTCHYEQFTTYLGGDGNLYRCCVTSYNDHGLIGNVAAAGGFRALWESEAKKQTFASFDARSCTMCQFSDRQREIEKLVKLGVPADAPALADTPHASFV